MGVGARGVGGRVMRGCVGLVRVEQVIDRGPVASLEVRTFQLIEVRLALLQAPHRHLFHKILVIKTLAGRVWFYAWGFRETCVSTRRERRGFLKTGLIRTRPS